LTTKLSKQFWDDSDSLIKGCTDDELIVLKSRVEKAIDKRFVIWNKKLDQRKTTTKGRRQ